MNRRLMGTALRLIIAVCLLLTGYPMSNAKAEPQGPVTSITTPEWGSLLSVSEGSLDYTSENTYTLWVDNTVASSVTINYFSDVEDYASYQKVSHGGQPGSDWSGSQSQAVTALMDSEDGDIQDIYFRASEEQIKVIVRFVSVQTTPEPYNTDEDAFLFGETSGFDGSTVTGGIEYSPDLDFQNDVNKLEMSYSDRTIGDFASNLERGTTYYYRAYVIIAGLTVYGSTETFTTAIIAGLDVKDASGTVLDKSAPFSYDTESYEVHVPYDTQYVNVVESVNLGTAIGIEDQTFDVDGTSSTAEWTPSNGLQTAAKQVEITANSTTVCVGSPIFTGLGSVAGPCSDYQFEVHILRDAAQVQTVETSPNVYNTDRYAYLSGTATGFNAGTPVGFEYSTDPEFENYDTSTEATLIGSYTSISGTLSELERGTTYYYRAYAKVGSTKVYGAKESFKTATITGLDVKDAAGTVLTKSPAAFSYDTATYEVHVPHDTTSVSVAESIDLGTAIDVMKLAFDIGGDATTEDWVTSGTTRTASRQVGIDSDLTTVCVAYAVFTGLAMPAGNCGSGQIEVKIIRDAAQVQTVVTSSSVYNTDVDAFLAGTATGFGASTPVGFEFSTDPNFVNFSTSTETALGASSTSIAGPISGLERGKTYYYRAYAKAGDVKVYGATQSFKTATITGLDVKNDSGTVLTKSPAAFSYDTTTYEVHVPYSTSSVTVAESVDMGTAMALQNLAFEVGGYSSSEPWTTSGTTRTAAHQVGITADSTTVCVAAPAFTGLGTRVGACGPGQFEVKIIRDAAPSTTSAPSTTTTSKAVLVLDSNPNETDQSAKTAITQIVGANLSMSGSLMTMDGKPLNMPDIKIGADGSFSLNNVPPGEYKVLLSVVAPTGEKLAGQLAKLTVSSDGSAKLEAGLIDPYGIVTDAVTGQTIDGADVSLHWADTELNRSKGRKPGDLVVLPELPDFAPNKNHDPQSTVNKGQYGWMVFPDGDYYVLAEKDGYETFDSRNDKRDEQQGDDSYIKNGNIHVGQSIVQYSFAMKPAVVGTGDHKPYMLGYPDGSFRPEQGMTRAETAAILNRLFAVEAGQAAAASFGDVKATHWAAKDIAAATAQKWMVGYPDGSFHPDQQVTRAELAQMLVNVKKWSSDADNNFADAKGHWAEKAIAALQAQGLISGYPDGTFRPNDPIKRVEADVIFNQLTGRTPWKVQAKQKWTDVAPSYWGYDAVMEASVPHAFEQFANGTENWTSQ